MDGDITTRVDWAVRTSLAVLFAAVLQPTQIVEFSGFGAFVAVMALDRNIGRTLANVRACIVGSAISASLCVVWLFLLRDQVYAMHVAHAASCYLLARWTSLPTMAQKLGLSLLPLILINGFNPGGNQSLELPLDFFLTVLLGCGCSVAASVMPLPQLRRKVQIRSAMAGARLVDSRNVSLVLLAQLLQSLVGAFFAEPMENHWRARVRREALGRLLRTEAENIRTRAKDAEWEVGLRGLLCWSPSPSYCLDNEALATKLRDAVEGLHVAEEAIKENTSTRVWDPFLRYLQTPLQNSLNAVTTLLYTLKVHTEGNFGFFGKHLTNIVSEDSEKIEATITACIDAQRKLQAEYRNARHEIYYRKGIRAIPITHDALLSLNVFIFYYAYTVDSVIDAAKAAVVRAQQDGRPQSSVAINVWSRCKPLYQEVTGTFVQGNLASDVRLRSSESRDAFKIAAAMVIAALFDALQGRNDPQPALAAFTVAYVCLSSTLSGNFNLGKLRLEGTVAGSIFSGFALSIPAVRDDRGLLVFLLCLFVFAAAYVRSSPTHSYAGTVAAFTAPVLMLALNDPNTRIEHTVVGIFIFVAVDTIVFSKQSTTLARSKLVAVLENLEKALYFLYAGYGPAPDPPSERRWTALLVPRPSSLGLGSSEPQLRRAASDEVFSQHVSPSKAASDEEKERNVRQWVRVERREQEEAREIMLAAAQSMSSGGKTATASAVPDEEDLLIWKSEARRLLDKVSSDLQQLRTLIRASESEPRVLRAAFPSDYMEKARDSCKSFGAYLVLALTAFQVLERRTVDRDSDGGSEVTPLAFTLGLDKDEDPTFRNLLCPLAGPLAVFSVDLALSMRVGALHAKQRLAGKAHRLPPSPPSSEDKELLEYNIDKKASKDIFLAEYDHICRLLQPNHIANPNLPLMSNVEVEAVNAIVFCLIQAMNGVESIMTAVGQLGEYDFLYGPVPQQRSSKLGVFGQFTRFNLTDRLLLAISNEPKTEEALAEKHVADDVDIEDPTRLSGGSGLNVNGWVRQRKAKLHWRTNLSGAQAPAFGDAKLGEKEDDGRDALAYLHPVRVLVTATGPDRVGIVADVTQIVYANRASVASSQMLRLGGDFCLMLLAVCPSSRQAAILRESLHEASSNRKSQVSPAGREAPHRQSALGLQIVTKVMGHDEPAKDVKDASTIPPMPSSEERTARREVPGDDGVHMGSLRLVGVDRPGLVYRVTSLLAKHGVSVERMQTEKIRVPAASAAALFGDDGSAVEGKPSTDTAEGLGNDGVDVFVITGAVSRTGQMSASLEKELATLGKTLKVNVELAWDA
mmetsp:Transcript_16619/g.63203  ORF Transcript_16619/g.63203 Transcript_16619/m.63203 type:complete len:1310 (-) Transcript_16619:8-3937(-)